MQQIAKWALIGNNDSRMMLTLLQPKTVQGREVGHVECNNGPRVRGGPLELLVVRRANRPDSGVDTASKARPRSAAAIPP
jgi:hypothetical protein